MKNKVRFGPAGNSQIFYEQGYKKSIDAPNIAHDTIDHADA